MADVLSKSGQLFNTIQGTLDKQLGHIADAVHIGSNENSEFFSNIPAVSVRDFDTYSASVKEHWREYRDICSSLIRAKEATITPAADIDDSSNAFREIPQVYFNSDYKHSGFEQHQIFTQPIRISVQNQGKLSGVLGGYQRKIEQHLVQHLSNVDGLLKSLMTVAVIQSDIAIAQDRAQSASSALARFKDREVGVGMRVIQLARRQARILELIEVLEKCEQVALAKPSVESLVQTGDFAAATELVQATRTILNSDLQNVIAVDSVRSFMEEHGRNIDGVIESEFADVVVAFVFDATDRVRLDGLLKSMSQRDLVVPCLQIRLKESLTKRLKKELKPTDSIDSLLASLISVCTRLSELIKIVLTSYHIDLEMKKLSCLRLMESVIATGLCRCSQSVLLQFPAPETPVEVFSILNVSELKTLRRTVLARLAEVETVYTEAFATYGLEEHVSFSASVVMSASQNGFSPDLESTITSVARQRLLAFHQAVLTLTESQLLEEKWDKSGVISDPVIQLINTLDPPVVDNSDSSPTSSAAPKFVRLNKISFLLVPSVLPVIQALGEYLNLALTVPGVALDSLSRAAAVVRTTDQTTRELVLEGQMTAHHKKVINATNLALSSQLSGMLAQLVPLLVKRFCHHYSIDHALVQSTGTESDGGEGEVLVEDATAVLNDLLVQVVLELNEHRMDVFIKLGDILISRFDHHVKLAVAIGQTPQASPALEGVAKDFSQMYKVLLKSLQTDNLKRVFSRAFSESGDHFDSKLADITNSPSTPLPVKSELACRLRTELLFMYQTLLAGESMTGVKQALDGLVGSMLATIESRLPLVDKSSAAEAAVVKLKDLLAQSQAN